MHIDIIPNRGYKETKLLRQSYRDGDNYKKRTLANVSELTMDQVFAMRKILKGERLVPVKEAFEVISSQHHGSVEAVLSAMRQLNLPNLIASQPSRESDIILGIMACRILNPDSKLATTRWWHNKSLPKQLAIEDATENDLYKAMDWLFKRQKRIQKKLAKRHLSEGSAVLYVLSSSYYEDDKYPLAHRGYNRDRKKGKLQG
ncbi:MAG: hypothetical protein ACLFSQ_10330 [Candidatus Zixiibacteriota bacterium]